MYHLYYYRWPRRLGHNAWVTHSEVAHAVGTNLFGPFRHRDVALPARGAQWWDGLCTHNPTVRKFGSRYFLYYMGNTGDGVAMCTLNWTHRNRQRVGVAVADHPNGPRERFDRPLIEPTPGFHDALAATNPTITDGPGGGLLMVYKAIGDRRPLPFGGLVVHCVALADRPEGPFEKQPDAIFTREGVVFPAEDPYRLAQGPTLPGAGEGQCRSFHRPGPVDRDVRARRRPEWRPASAPLVATTELTWEDGVVQRRYSLERPQWYFENGRPAALLFAADENPRREHSFNVRVPVEVGPSAELMMGQTP